MKKRLTTFLFVLIFLVGSSILAYPFVTSIISSFGQSAVVSDYNNKVDDTTKEVLSQMLEQAQKYNNSIFGKVILTDPFDASSAQNQSEEFDYDRLLSLDSNGTMGYITIPAIDVNLPIYHGTAEKTLESGVGHLVNTSLPVGGESTHCVLAGHTGLPNATLFTNLDDLKEGDTFYIHILGKVNEYRINQIKVVEPSDTSDLGIVRGKDYITLVTCTPYGINSHRLLVRGERTSYNSDDDHYSETIESKNDGFYFCGIFISYIMFGIVLGAILLIIAGMVVISVVKKRKKKSEIHKEE